MLMLILTGVQMLMVVLILLLMLMLVLMLLFMLLSMLMLVLLLMLLVLVLMVSLCGCAGHADPECMLGQLLKMLFTNDFTNAVSATYSSIFKHLIFFERMAPQHVPPKTGLTGTVDVVVVVVVKSGRSQQVKPHTPVSMMFH